MQSYSHSICQASRNNVLSALYEMDLGPMETLVLFLTLHQNAVSGRQAGRLRGLEIDASRLG